MYLCVLFAIEHVLKMKEKNNSEVACCIHVQAHSLVYDSFLVHERIRSADFSEQTKKHLKKKVSYFQSDRRFHYILITELS